jgi:hypothetical protein
MTARKGRGRPPSIWRSPIGYKFVEAVAHAKYRHPRPITTGLAIKIVLKQPEFAELRKYANGSTRYLEKQLIDVADFFGMHPTTRELIGRSSRIYWNRKSATAGGENVLLIALVLLDNLALAVSLNELLEH